MTWDTVVIGSGPGGLTAALALARAGQRVLVLEQHYLPGGWAHSFALEGYRFSPGVHYLGELGPGGAMRGLYEGLGIGGELEFLEMNPDGFDHLLIDGERFDVPRGRDRLVERLVARFPHEREGIRRYFDVLDGVGSEAARLGTAFGVADMLALPWRAPTLLRWGLRTQGALLDACVRDPMARAFLCGQNGNHALAPEDVSLPVHAAMIRHYYDGGYYPRGGARRIPQAMIRALRAHGGAIRTSARVARVLVEGGRARGVELAETGERIEARCVVSNADAAHTYGRLLAPEHAPRLARRAARAGYSVASISVFCAVEMDLRAAGFDSGNYWWYRTRAVGELYKRMERELFAPDVPFDGVFVAIPSLKDPTHAQPHGHHTLELFVFCPWAPFARWARDPQGARSPEYNAFKERLGDRVIEAAERVIPGLRRAVRFREVGTPLTNDHYCASVRGAVYGTRKTPWQVGPFGFPVRAPVRGLYCCGASVLGHGLAAASYSGLMAAQQALGAARPEALLAPTDGSIRVTRAADLARAGTDGARVVPPAHEAGAPPAAPRASIAPPEIEA